MMEEAVWGITLLCLVISLLWYNFHGNHNFTVVFAGNTVHTYNIQPVPVWGKHTLEIRQLPEYEVSLEWKPLKLLTMNALRKWLISSPALKLPDCILYLHFQKRNLCFGFELGEISAEGATLYGLLLPYSNITGDRSHVPVGNVFTPPIVLESGKVYRVSINEQEVRPVCISWRNKQLFCALEN